MTDAELKPLIARRKSALTSLSAIEKYVREKVTAENFDIDELHVRHDRLEQIWSQLEEVHVQLEDLKPNEYEKSHSENEERYLTLKTKFKKYLNPTKIAKPVDEASEQTGVNTQLLNNDAGKINVNLPTLKIPPFDGRYDQWHSFYDVFKALIHENDNLSGIEKLYYLKSNLKGEALRIIEGVPTTTDNYEVSLELLQDRYDKKQFIKGAHIKALFEIPKVAKNSPVALRSLISEAKQHLRSLATLELKTEHWDPLLVHMLSEKLDYQTRRDLEMHKSSEKDMPLTEFYKFIENRCTTLEALQHSDTSQVIRSKVTLVTTDKQKTRYQCSLCKDGHFLYLCKKFEQFSYDNKRKAIKENNLCYNCLRPGHSVNKCFSRGCRKCNEKHHTSLHQDSHKSDEVQKENVQNPIEGAVTLINSTEQIQIVLSTVQLKIQTGNKSYLNCRALLDSASQANFITTRFFKKLNINNYEKFIPINGIENSRTSTTSAVTLTIKSKLNNFEKNLEFLIIDNITHKLPSKYIEIQDLNIPSTCMLADPAFNVPAPIDLLIGGEIFFELLEHGTMSLGQDLPIIQNSVFGWIIGGKCGSIQSEPVNTFLLTTEQLNDSLTKFWNIENCYTKSDVQSLEEKQCESIFQKTTKRNDAGRYIVNLPLKEDPHVLGDSYEEANRRFNQLEKRFIRNPELHANYKAFMDEYIQLEHMEILHSPMNQGAYFIPHHAVFKRADSTKIRVVFDASMKTTSGKSLNDLLMIGPTLYQDLFSIIIRFRKHRVAFSADVQKMYRQILINENQRSLQTILWRKEDNDDIQKYCLNTVTYGTSAAPYLATKCVQQLAIDEKSNYPLAAERISKDVYVDDVLTGAENESEALTLQQQIISIFKAGCFELHKWCSNLESLVANIGNTEDKTIPFTNENETKTLGIIWSPKKDIFKFTFNLPLSQESTKRMMLSTIASLFDPLGILGPIIVKAKLLIQELWELKISWDEQVPVCLSTQWTEWKRQLQEENHLVIPRCLIQVNNPTVIEIHGFCDASMVAYGAVLYLRCENEINISVRLICSKSRIAPIKQVSLPRLELCGAVLLSRLANSVIHSLEINLTNVYLWTDSTIVLSWLKETPSKWTTFVANRVSEVQELTRGYHWKHIPSKSNPADALSRGSNLADLKSSTLWWQGPRWISSDKSHWPKDENVIPSNIPETRTTKQITSLLVATNQNEIFERFSRFSRLIRSIAFGLRFIHNVRKLTPRASGYLTTQEIHNSKMYLIKIVQRDAFQEEISLLNDNKPILSSSKIIALNPFVDTNGILRVGGRIKHSLVPYEQQHPIILPQRHRFTHLLIEAEHVRLLHAGAQSVLASLRRHYWPINAKSVVRKILHRCIKCFRFRTKGQTQLMADLPQERLQPSRPFLNVGLDYGGPIYIKTSKRRNAPLLKTYIALFVCMSTKAIHLELAIDLSTEAFLRVLQRFVSRRGVCKTIHSDNGTNFKGARNELNELYKLFTTQLSKTKIDEFITQNCIEWKFIPPNSPHFGGIWESGIRSVKYHLKRTIRNAHLSYEETYTLLTEIEACLNSRPLIPVSTDPKDYDILTPSHFLIGDMLTSIPCPDYDEIATNRLSRLQFIQKLQQTFWKKWSTTYLNELQQRNKWRLKNTTLRENQLVLVREDNLPPLKWIIARIVHLHPGADDLPRVATIQTATGAQFKRPIVKLCPLPIPEAQDHLKQTLQRGRDVESYLATRDTATPAGAPRSNITPCGVGCDVVQCSVQCKCESVE